MIATAAAAIGLANSSPQAATPGEIDVAFATLAQERPDALFAADAFFGDPRRAIHHAHGARQNSGGLFPARLCGRRRAVELRADDGSEWPPGTRGVAKRKV